MTLTIQRLFAVALIAAVLPTQTVGTAQAQGAPQTVALMKVDLQAVATGYRTTKLVGSTVVNDANETVGTIDDLIVTPNDKVPFVVLSIGGFLGMNAKYIVVSSTDLEIQGKKMVLHGATKDSLKDLPNYKYTD